MNIYNYLLLEFGFKPLTPGVASMLNIKYEDHTLVGSDFLGSFIRYSAPKNSLTLSQPNGFHIHIERVESKDLKVLNAVVIKTKE